MPESDGQGLLLPGLDGSNPLGFLAAVGAAASLNEHNGTPGRSIRLRWRNTQDGWRPVIAGCGVEKHSFCEALLASLKKAPMTAFDIGNDKNGQPSKKFPFDCHTFVETLGEKQRRSSATDRRDVDFLVSFGTDMYPDAKTAQFQDTSFRMVRSGDSKGQGLLFYAKANRKRAGRDDIIRALFHAWDHLEQAYSLRWDPTEDQRYALRWRDPSDKSQSNVADGPATLQAANSLAIEALRYLPTVLAGTPHRIGPGNRRPATTTGFHQMGLQTSFVWPLWSPMVDMETVRSLLALGELHGRPLHRASLHARGIEEVYGAERIQANQYYSNFAPAQPRM